MGQVTPYGRGDKGQGAEGVGERIIESGGSHWKSLDFTGQQWGGWKGLSRELE